MPERVVYCGGLKPGRKDPDALHIDVDAPSGTANRVNLEIGSVAERLADNIPDVLTDLLEIAAYVYCADQFTGRGSSQMSNMGAQWRRKLRFKIPVRNPDLWSNPELNEAMTETLGFLSEDDFAFEFVRATHSPPLQRYLSFNDPSAQKLSPDEIILFSGGLDSLAGSVEALLGTKKRVVLLSHQPSKFITSKQNDLVSQLRERAQPGALFYIPVVINKGHEEAAEFTQRTRSFMFACLGLVVARMFGRRDLNFYENGVVSINLPIADHVLGARASRTTHPRFFRDCSRLFSILLSEQFTIYNPYIWKTKSDVVRVLAEHNCADLISRTMSCTRIREATKTGQHCGVCSQCVDRRIGVLAAGMAEFEAAENYTVDLFAGAHPNASDVTLIESYVLRAQRLRSMSRQDFAANYGQVFRMLSSLEGAADENVTKIWDLHRRHGEEVVSVVDKQLADWATVSRMLELPSTSLIAMVASPVADQPTYVDPVEAEPGAAEQAARDEHDYSYSPVLLGVDRSKKEIIFAGGISFKGAAFKLIALLAEELARDAKAGAKPTDHRFVSAKRLASALDVEEQTLRQQVSRCRDKFERAFMQRFDRHLEDADIIQNEGWKGYRLNPFLILADPDQLRQTQRPVSHVGSNNVTSSDHLR